MDRTTVDRYLHRIGYAGALEPSTGALAALQTAHLLAVPFENLDIHWGRPIVLDEDRLTDKIIDRGRGGFCYELNGSFARLLAALGYELTLLSARVFRADGSLGPEHDHLALLVELDGRWLVDVGFGDAFVTPLPLDRPGPYLQRGRAYRVERGPRGFIYSLREESEGWAQQYAFDEMPRELSEFLAMCRFHQSSPDSHFTQKRVISRLTTSGRVTLRERRLIVTEGRTRRETPIEDEAAWRRTLSEHFGLEPPD